MSDSEFRRWDLEDTSTVAAIFEGCRRGIYVLHFANGERYVGQAIDVVTRYSCHRHGSKHHQPWADIVAIEFMEVPDGDLNVLERETIQRLRAQYPLRNKAFNFGHEGPSVLDPVVPIEVQRHWATGQPSYDIEQYAAAAQRAPGPTPKLLTKRRSREILPDGRPVWAVVIDELAQVVMHIIPNAVDTEGRYWSISDYPETAGGRFATLNVGWLELAAFPRARQTPEVGTLQPSNDLMWFLNAELGTFVDEDHLPRRLRRDRFVWYSQEIDGLPVYFERSLSGYSVPVDRICLPLGAFGVNAFSPEERRGARRLAIRAMRTGTARVNARSYSAELTRLVYARIVELQASSTRQESGGKLAVQGSSPRGRGSRLRRRCWVRRRPTP